MLHLLAQIATTLPTTQAVTDAVNKASQPAWLASLVSSSRQPMTRSSMARLLVRDVNNSRADPRSHRHVRQPDQHVRSEANEQNVQALAQVVNEAAAVPGAGRAAPLPPLRNRRSARTARRPQRPRRPPSSCRRRRPRACRPDRRTAHELHRLRHPSPSGRALRLFRIARRTQWASQRESLTNAENTLTPAVTSGKLTRTEIDIADAGVQAWRAALADAEAHLPAGGSVFEQDIQIAKSVGKRLADTYLAPATQPSGEVPRRRSGCRCAIPTPALGRRRR
jgi:hypothetical protein